MASLSDKDVALADYDLVLGINLASTPHPFLKSQWNTPCVVS